MNMALVSILKSTAQILGAAVLGYELWLRSEELAGKKK